MKSEIRIMQWNANGLLKHKADLLYVLKSKNIDICLISETHFTKESHIFFENYKIYHTIHPCNKARGGSAIIVKDKIVHWEEEKIQLEHFQATTITIMENKQYLTVTSLYSPPKHNIKHLDYVKLLETHKHKFIIGGDFNAKHVKWGSRLTTTKGRELLKAIEQYGCNVMSTCLPTYWPTDKSKSPDLIDFFITNKISRTLMEVEEGFELNSDHSPIYLIYKTTLTVNKANPKLISPDTDWEFFEILIKKGINSFTQIETTDDLENEVQRLTKIIQNACWSSTPTYKKPSSGHTYPLYIRNMVKQKRNQRKKWQMNRSPQNKQILNKLTQKLRKEIKKLKNSKFNQFISKLTYDSKTDYSLWKATKKLNCPKNLNQPLRTIESEWAKTDLEKANAFAKHLYTIFSNKSNSKEENVGLSCQEIISKVTLKEILQEIKCLKNKKSPGFDLITAEVLKNLPLKALAKITKIFNSAIRLNYVPTAWKVAEVIMVPKPGKDLNEVSSYRPISLLPLIGKLFEKIIGKRLNSFIERMNLIPSHQFGFRKGHSTIEQIHRITHDIEEAFEKKEVCSAVFLDISQAFDGVVHTSLIHKLKSILPDSYCKLMESYLNDRFFRVKQGNEYSEIYPIYSGVPQGSILGPFLYLLYTYDLPSYSECTIGTFADDTVIVATGKTNETSTIKLQNALAKIDSWTEKWGLKLNSSKSVHVDFTQKTKTTHKPIFIKGKQVPIADSAKYLGVTLDSKLKWKAHVANKKKALEIKYRELKWLIGRKSLLSISNKLMIYKQVLKPIWLYGIQLWGCANESTIQSIQLLQNKILRDIVKAPWYIRNSDIHRDLKISTVREEIQQVADNYEKRLHHHKNPEIPKLMEANITRRLNRYKPFDLKRRFTQLLVP